MKSFLVLPATAALMLAGCNSATDITTFVQTVQADAVAICGFEPEAVAIADIIGAFVPAVSEAGQIAQEICSAATSLKSARRLGPREITVTVRGVRVTGHFVR